MQINFYPESNNPKFEKAAIQYNKIWEKDGKKIIRTIEKVSGLRFGEKVINAVTFGGNSVSIPLELKSEVPIKNMKGTLVHELCHRLIAGNNAHIHYSEDRYKYFIEYHKPVTLILYDIWIELYGKDYAARQIEYEMSSVWKGKAISPYKIVWVWALGMTKEEKQKKFKKYFK